MDELKASLNRELSHVREVWFDQHGNWYIHKVPTAVKCMTREEILGAAKKENPNEEDSKGSGKKKKGAEANENEDKK